MHTGNIMAACMHGTHVSGLRPHVNLGRSVRCATGSLRHAEGLTWTAGRAVRLAASNPRLAARRCTATSRAATLSVQCSAGGVKVYGHPGTRSPLVDWYLHEIGQAFENRPPNHPENPHPFGQVPALSDGEVEVFESGAILLYLADKYGGLDTPEKRAAVGKWVMWANATLDPILFKETPQGKVIGTSAGDKPKGLLRLDATLEGREFLVGDSFSVADVAIAAYLLYVPQFFAKVDMGIYPNIAPYMLRCVKREAYGRAFGADTQNYCRAKCEEYMQTVANGGKKPPQEKFKLF